MGEKASKFADLVENHPDLDQIFSIHAGKFRRFHGEVWYKRLFDIKTHFQNFIDLILFVGGLFESWKLLNKIHPDVILLKGGYVGVPIGLMAAVKKIKFITHDSDAIPGLANRLVSRWAKTHAVGLPAKYYSYPPQKTVWTGVIVGEQYRYCDAKQIEKSRKKLHLPLDSLILLVTGGSLGALKLNHAMVKIAQKLLNDYHNLIIIHQVGRGKSGNYHFINPRLIELEFLNPMVDYSSAADLVVSRAGANTLAELGTQAKAVIVVANPLLAGGHQLKNVENLLADHAVLAVEERSNQPYDHELDQAIRRLLDSPSQRIALANRLRSITKTDAAEVIADLLLNSADNRK